ncbi:MAG TPA: dTMP kinase [Ktedonobacteraceae bacterium]|nr:dTMP kinase [Ktedonobacteraceae bacterium]
MSRGYLISFEGLDGAGKTTQLLLLDRWLTEHHVQYVRTREPGGTAAGVEIRRLLLERPELALHPLAEAFLFQADRAQHFATVIEPALAAGTLVVTDRCLDSSIAYQGAGRGLGVELIEQLSLLATQGRVPDLTILLDLDPEHVQLRTNQSQDESGLRSTPDRFDQEEKAFHVRLRQAFLDLARKYPARIKVIDASQTPEAMHAEIVQAIVAAGLVSL